MTHAIHSGPPKQEISDAQTHAAIREMMRENAQEDSQPRHRIAKQKTLPALAPAEEDVTAAPKAGSHPHVRAGRTLRFVQRKHIVFATFTAVCLIWPWWVAAVFLVIIALIGCAFFMAGAERIWKGVLLGLRQVGEKDSARAHRIRVRLDAFAMKWDRVLDVFPDGWVDGLYMPDLQALDTEDLDHQAAVLRRLQRFADSQ